MKIVKTKVVHSKSKTAWNVVGTQLGKKFKIAIVHYIVSGNVIVDALEKNEALKHAEFISWCFNNADKILSANTA